jgi:hypothetical protein
MKETGCGVTAQDFYDYEKCPHRVFLNHHGQPKERLPLSDFLNLLFERALVHEEDVVKDLPHNIPGGKTQEAACTVALRAGVERIATVFSLPGFVSLSAGGSGRSKFELLHKPVDMKSGSGYHDEGKDSSARITGCSSTITRYCLNGAGKFTEAERIGGKSV